MWVAVRLGLAIFCKCICTLYTHLLTGYASVLGQADQEQQCVKDAMASGNLLTLNGLNVTGLSSCVTVESIKQLLNLRG